MERSDGSFAGNRGWLTWLAALRVCVCVISMQGDVRYLKDIEQFYNTQIEEMPLDVADLI